MNTDNSTIIPKTGFIKANLSYFWISLAVILLDQLSKFLVRQFIPLGHTIYLTKSFFWLTHVENTGAAFSLSLGSESFNRTVFIILSVIVSAILIRMILFARVKIEKIAYCLILGGAIGNLIDRIFIGGVTDFLWCDFPDFIMSRWPVFNLADSSIVIAITLLLIHTIFFESRKEKQ